MGPTGRGASACGFWEFLAGCGFFNDVQMRVAGLRVAGSACGFAKNRKIMSKFS